MLSFESIDSISCSFAGRELAGDESDSHRKSPRCTRTGGCARRTRSGVLGKESEKSPRKAKVCCVCAADTNNVGFLLFWKCLGCVQLCWNTGTRQQVLPPAPHPSLFLHSNVGTLRQQPGAPSGPGTNAAATSRQATLFRTMRAVEGDRTQRLLTNIRGMPVDRLVFFRRLLLCLRAIRRSLPHMGIYLHTAQQARSVHHAQENKMLFGVS